MIPTLVIGLREGLEASLIVGIVAAFLVQEGRRDALRPMWWGVGLAATLCLGVGVALQVVDSELPQRQQEGLETLVGLLAVAFVTFMIVWMRRHARSLRHDLEQSAGRALVTGSVAGLVAMAFFAVLREGFETSVFLLAAFQSASDPTLAGLGALIGVIVAVGIGWGIYQGGIRINLARFFRVTGAVLVFVAAGLLATAAHTAHEAGWFNSLQGQAVDLSGIVEPGTVRAALLTGMLGLQPYPTVGEAIVYFAYALPVGLYVLWPDRFRRRRRARRPAAAVTASLLLIAVLVAGCGSDSSSGGRKVEVALTDAGCDPAKLNLPAGATDFHVTNKGTAKVTEFEVLKDGRVLGEKENLADGLDGTFSLTLKKGDYDLSCPGGDSASRGTLVVRGGSQTKLTPAQNAAVATYRRYLERQSADLLTATRRFAAAVRDGNAARAKDLFATAREPYENIEPVAETFGDLDPAIDARINDVDGGFSKWTGFHRLEWSLWKKRNLGHAETETAGRLLDDVEQLESKVKTVDLEPAQIANGANELLGEVSKSKITGEEDRYSHTDLWDFQANLDGSRVAFEAVRPLLDKSDPDLAKTIAGRFTDAQKDLDRYRRGDGWVIYTDLDSADTRRLSQSIDALAEPLSKAPGQLTSS
ncbi:MAG TPA: iron uptake system protein EfeO [Thermoleophilaceae bacterium]